MVNLFVFEDSDVVDGKVVIRDPAKVEHLKKVLKVEVGSTIKMGMLGGMLYTGHITAIVPDVSYEVRLEAVAGSEWNPLVGSAGVCLLLGTPRPSMTKSISTVSATMGVDQIVFVKSERVDKSYFQSKTMGGPEMKKNLIHGAEQGVLRRLPETCCFPNHSLEAFLKDAWPEVEAKLKKQHPQRHIVKLIAEPRVPSNILRATCEELASVPGAEEPFFVIAIGPEGGWVKRKKNKQRERSSKENLDSSGSGNVPNVRVSRVSLWGTHFANRDGGGGAACSSCAGERRVATRRSDQLAAHWRKETQATRRTIKLTSFLNYLSVENFTI